MSRPVYLDCNATTPVEPRVLDAVRTFLEVEFGNAGSRTHEFGTTAKKAVARARAQVASVVGCEPDEVILTSGATESNNIVILGLTDWAQSQNKRHVVTTEVEHKAVLEPLAELEKRGFEVERVRVEASGAVAAEAVLRAVRDDTALVSVMAANNETGVLQPIEAIASGLKDHGAFFHVDAAQTFGKHSEPLGSKRVDFVSLSGHKLFAPKGIGALIARRRGFRRPPLRPLVFGGGQERGLRPGTLAVPLVVGLGVAAEMAVTEAATRAERVAQVREQVLAAFTGVAHQVNGEPQLTLPHVLNVSFDGVDSEALMVVLKDLVAISNGSACTSSDYSPSHVLQAMGLDSDRIDGAVRVSWSHLTSDLPVETIQRRIRALVD